MLKKNFPLFLPLCFVFLVLASGSVFAANAGDPQRQDFAAAAKQFNDGEYKQALAQYWKILKAEPDSKEAILNEAIIYKYLGDYEKAAWEYRRLLKIQPDKLIYFGLGEVYYLDSQPDRALKSFRQALALGQEGALIHFWMAECYRDKADIPQAVSEYKKAVTLDSEFAVAYMELGRIYKQQQDWTAAEQALLRVRKLDPSIRQVFTGLAEVYYARQKYSEALEAFRKVKSIDPQNKKAQIYTDKIMKIAGCTLKPELKSKEAQRLAEKMPKIVVPVSEGGPLVSVHIGDLKRLRFKCASGFTLKTAKKKKIFLRGAKNCLYNIISKGREMIISSGGKTLFRTAHPFLIVPDDTPATILIFDVKFGQGNYWAASMDGSYRGSLQIGILPGGDIRLINILNMEEYIYGVLPSEMSADWPLQALKAQAIAARTEAYTKMNRHKKEGFDFCSQVHCQVYSGARVEDPRSNQAVDETRGIIAEYKGKSIDAIYSNSCGGHTQGNIFGNQEYIPYLEGKPDFIGPSGFSFPLSPLELEDWLWSNNIAALCNNEKFSRNSNFRWMRIYNQKEISRLVAKKKDVGSIRNIEILDRSISGHIKRIRIIGTKGTLTVKEELPIRRLLGNLRSSMFSVDIKRGRAGAEEFIFYGGGWGHAVGMCQVGAATMAEKGYNYEQILKFYYTGIQLKKMY